MEAIRIRIAQAKEGMTVATDVYNANNQLIVPKMEVLNNSTIEKMKEHNIYGIYVYKTQQTFDMQKESYLDYLRETEDFKEFNEVYIQSLEDVRTSFIGIMNKEEVDFGQMIHTLNDIMAPSKNGAHMLEMLHGIRDYDDITYTHSINVAIICNVFASWLNLSSKDKEALTLCGFLHDIGKMVIPPEISLKADKLTEDEYRVMKTHTTKGYQILKERDIDDRVKLAALLHHERCDGTGYPNGFMSRSIHSFAKIVAIADAYDAMTSDRTYRRGICPFDVVDEFEKDGLTKYDPAYLMLFLERIVHSYINNIVKLSDGRQAEVILINKLSLASPVVRINDEFIDLSKRKDLKIVAVI